jgi:aminoglycoside/choline kinase family phosphotransferase
MLSETLIEQTLSRFPQTARADVTVQPLEKGGSDRKYYRIEMGGLESLILVKYGDQREENRHYVSIARFLDTEGIRVPRIYFHDETERLIWMEDLGEVDLWEHRLEPWNALLPLYCSALDQVALLHGRAHLSPQRTNLELQNEFNAELYLWEQNYFFENCAERYFKVDPTLVDLHRRSEVLTKIAMELATLPRVFVHRDFQSQNIMIKGGKAYLIDFQGLRPGLPQYDLASLVYDPYVALEEAQRGELLEYYIQKHVAYGDASGEFRRIFNLCAMQRLMQALGAYGFLGLVKERLEFLQHIQPALASLKIVLARIPGMESMRAFVDTLA